jgi:hypothetical protein
MSMIRERSVFAFVSFVVCLAIAPFAAADDDECPDPALRGGARGSVGATGGAVGGLGGAAVGGLGAVGDATADVGGDVGAGIGGVGGAVAGSLPAPGSPDVSRLGEIGIAFETEGRLDEAWLALSRFRVEASAQYEADRARIDAALGRIQARLGGVIVESDVDGAEVWVRGNLAARLPMENAIYVAPGGVRLTVRARGRAAAELDVDAQIGQTARVRAELPDVGAGGVGDVGLDGPGDLDADAEVSGGGPGLLFWVVGGVAVVGAGVAIGATVVRSNLSGDIDDLRVSMPMSPEIDSLQGSLDTAAVWQIGAFVVAGLAIAGALTIYLLSDATADSHLECPTATARRRPPALTLACTPGLLGVGCEGRF